MTVVTVLGTGGLGTAIARRLGEQGLEVRVWNRHADKAERAADGAAYLTAVASAEDAIDGADLVLTVLRDADVVASVVEPLVHKVTGVWLQVSTVGPTGATRLGTMAADHGVRYLDAPVSGSTEPAAQGELVWLVAGDADVLAAARPVLDATGKTVQHVGTGTSEASALKLAVNAWMTASTVVMSDVLALCDGMGVDHDALRDALDAGPLAMPYALQKSTLMDDQSFEPGFSIANALKDLGLAAELHTPSPVLREVQTRLARADDAGHGQDDLAGVSQTE